MIPEIGAVFAQAGGPAAIATDHDPHDPVFRRPVVDLTGKTRAGGGIPECYLPSDSPDHQAFAIGAERDGRDDRRD
jgi:hypothetical protein